jgi:uncharacterized protein (UPF0335 family)
MAGGDAFKLRRVSARWRVRAVDSVSSGRRGADPDHGQPTAAEHFTIRNRRSRMSSCRDKAEKEDPMSETQAAAETNVAADELRAFIERIERLEEEKKTISDDVKDVYGEAKSRGYDVKVLRKIVSIRKQDQNERQEMDAILELYMQALGMV